MSDSETFIKLDQFLKWQALVETGGQAKSLIQQGRVRVNNRVETRRGRKLVSGDVVSIGGRSIVVELEDGG